MNKIVIALFFFIGFNLSFSQTETEKTYPNAMTGYWSQYFNRTNNQLVLTRTTREKSPTGIQLNADGTLFTFYPRKCGNDYSNRLIKYWYVEKKTLHLVISSVKYKVIKANNNLVVLSKL